VLEIDTPMYSKIERGDRRAKREQISVIAEILKTDPEEFLTLWLADQVTEVVENDKGISDKVLDIAKERINN
jgi:transcriptional regulator with XRE-family HTH domain